MAAASPSPDADPTVDLDRNLQIVACAGAGKTEAVSQRVVAQLQLPGVKPENVVAFTFNERAAAELKERIALHYEKATRSRDGLADVFVGTIHAFCLDLLQQHHFNALSYRVLNDVQQRLLISRFSRKSGLGDLGWHRYHDAKAYAELVAILREADIDQDKLDGSPVGECLDKYCDVLANERYLDFTSIVSETVGLLESEPAFRERVEGRVRYLTVDEYQDVNPIQERLIAVLADMGAKVTVVGDDDQLLYGWRGSRVANILEFADRYADVKTIRLERNFRSSPGIVGLARNVIERNPQRLDKEMDSAGRQAYEEGDIELLEFPNPEAEAHHIVARIKDLLGTPFRDQPDKELRGLTYADMVVLVRVKRLIEPITSAFDDAGIPYVVAGIASLFNTPEACAARSLFYFLAGELDEAGLRASWVDARLGLSDEDLDRGLATARENWERIQSGEGRFGIYNLQRSFLDFLTAIELREEKVAQAAGGGPEGARRGEIVYYNLGKFSEVISDFEQIHFRSAPQEKYSSFTGFLRHQAEDLYPEGWLEARYVTPDAVQILTIHQAKGLQWPVVFVPGLTKGRFPPSGRGGRSPWSVIPDGLVRNASDYAKSEDDERRLFYVACTRAKKYLTISRAAYPTNQRSWRRPSPFWREAQEAFDQLPPPAPRPNHKKLASEREGGMSDVILSFSELKYAFECPYSFKLRFLYGFNPPLDEALGYGKGLHDCLFELHDRALNGGDTSRAIVEELVDRHLYLPFAYSDLREKLTASAQRRLREYIAKRGATFDDIEHAERPVEIDLGDGIRVTGRIDLIRRRSTHEVIVIDFKSNDRVQQAEVTDLQLRVYALGYQQATGEPASEVVVENLDDLDNPAVSPVTPAMLTEARRAIRTAGERMRRNDYPREPRGENHAARRRTCQRCDLSGICGAADRAEQAPH